MNLEMMNYFVVALKILEDQTIQKKTFGTFTKLWNNLKFHSFLFMNKIECNDVFRIMYKIANRSQRTLILKC